jgi:nondiscriminating glutamyl-tRNA synthetase
MNLSSTAATHSLRPVRVRFAPSPTGYLHVGGARTALYNYLFAKRNNGKFILRIEDTDLARSTDESLKMVISDLKWLGLNWDEGPHPETLEDMGTLGPYKQSQRLAIYKKVADELLQKGKAYYCFLTDDEIESQREKAKAENSQAHVESPYENLPLTEALAKISRGEKAVVRFKTRHLKKDFILNDLIRKEVKFPSDMVGDFVLLRSDGMPVYNFCCVVDDYQMQISHILRAEEHLPNTLRQLMIYEAMSWQVPEFGHISLVLDEDRQKLSKRRGATSCHQFQEEGYLPEALKNFIALLGWSHPEGLEIMNTDEMKKSFSIERLNSSGAIFDRVKLKWMNAQHLRAMLEAELWPLVAPFLQRAGIVLPTDQLASSKSTAFPTVQDWQIKSLQTFKTSMETLADAVTLYQPLDDSKFEISAESEEVFAWGEITKLVLSAWKNELQVFSKDFLTEDEFLQVQDRVKATTQAKGKNLFQPIRVAVIGKPHGTELKILVPLMPKSSLLKRVDIALLKMS